MGIYTQEKIGLIPQSIGRTLSRARQQLLPEGRLLAIEEFRISRLRTIVALQCFVILVTVPFFVNYVSKTIIIKPSIQKIWNIEHNDIFLNSYQMKRAFSDMEEFQNILFFDFFTKENNFNNQQQTTNFRHKNNIESQPLFCLTKQNQNFLLEQQIKKKAVQLAFKYNQQSIQSVTDFLGDIITMITIRILILQLKAQIVFLKAFLLECFYSLNDAKKSVFIFFFTDLLVGYHSPKGWQLVTEMLLRHYGLPENPIFIKFIIAILPVLFDTLFKYWIFRHLNRTSPSTVVTYHALIE